jgi:para-aminobenzoate synthetase component 1
MSPAILKRVSKPVIEEVSCGLSAEDVFEYFRNEPYCFFLDSGAGYGELGRYSFIGCNPFLIVKSVDDSVEVSGVENFRVRGSPFTVLRWLLSRFRVESCCEDLPFVGGAVGYFGYDLRHFIERLPRHSVNDLKIPDMFVGFYDSVLIFDHVKGKSFVSHLPGFRRGNTASEMKRRLLPAVEVEGGATISDVFSRKDVEIRSNFSREGYIEAVKKVKEYIAAGDIFQVNLSQRFEANLSITPFELYRRLRKINPAPFASYLDFGEVKIVSSSPERFLKVENSFVETRPIKGTRPRGRDAAEDRKLADELLSSVKDRAENVMIVDLERNDLGRVCEYGSVQVPDLLKLETHPTVFHLVSTIVGSLRKDKDCIDLLEACFPGGSITGAPKVRAMEIIDEIEPTTRGVYTGSIGYIGFDGNIDTNIVIRTFVIKEDKAYFQVGGGIVIDSDPEKEYLETLDKASALIQALRL